MTSVHGVSVAGGTFPAQIWNSYYNNAAVPCESFTIPTETMDYSSFGGGYTVDADTTTGTTGDTGATDEDKTDKTTDDPANPDQRAGRRPGSRRHRYRYSSGQHRRRAGGD
jgi:hypothetical protein